MVRASRAQRLHIVLEESDKVKALQAEIKTLRDECERLRQTEARAAVFYGAEVERCAVLRDQIRGAGLSPLA